MTVVASIKCGPGINMDWWESFVFDHEALEAPVPREETEPLDASPVSWARGRGACNVTIDGHVAGSIAPSAEIDETWTLFVHASDRDEHWVEELVEAISEAVDGRVVRLSRLGSGARLSGIARGARMGTQRDRGPRARTRRLDARPGLRRPRTSRAEVRRCTRWPGQKAPETPINTVSALGVPTHAGNRAMLAAPSSSAASRDRSRNPLPTVQPIACPINPPASTSDAQW